MTTERFHRLAWMAFALAVLVFGIAMYYHKVEDGVAVCKCAIFRQATAKGEFGNFDSVRWSAERLIETVKSETLKRLLFERCAKDLKSVPSSVVSNAINGIAVEVVSRSNNEWRFSITARSTQRRVAVVVANDCADVLKEFLESENQRILEKKVSQILAKEASLKRRLKDLNAEAEHLSASSPGIAMTLKGRSAKIQEEMASLTRDETFVRTNHLANCDVMLVLNYAE